jgi:hypothetical protein
MALANAQSLMINQRVAAEAADYLLRLLVTGGLKKFQTFIDLPVAPPSPPISPRRISSGFFRPGELAEARVTKTPQLFSLNNSSNKRKEGS